MCSNYPDGMSSATLLPGEEFDGRDFEAEEEQDYSDSINEIPEPELELCPLCDEHTLENGVCLECQGKEGAI